MPRIQANRDIDGIRRLASAVMATGDEQVRNHEWWQPTPKKRAQITVLQAMSWLHEETRLQPLTAGRCRFDGNRCFMNRAMLPEGCFDRREIDAVPSYPSLFIE